MSADHSPTGAQAEPVRTGARAERLRTTAEWLLRALALALLVWSLAQALRPRAYGPPEAATSATLEESLARWSTIARPEGVHVELAHPPEGTERDWLAALPGAGTAVHWSGPSLLPTAAALEPRADPAGGVDVSVAAPEGSEVVLSDTLGVLDTLRAGPVGVRVHLAEPPEALQALQAAVGPVVARAARLDSLVLGRLLVLGSAGWESKFVTAALEERGWRVDAHLVVSPETVVRQGVGSGPASALGAAIDTARYSAVLALDSTAARYGESIARYVRRGGGLILWSPAAQASTLAPLAAGAPGTLIEDEGRAPEDTAPRQALSLVPITSPTPDAVVLERQGEHVTLAARRIAAGRVIQNGYVNAWRWRMAGGEDAPERHRAWLAALVARVAYTGRVERAAPPSDAAPLATLIDRLGPATAAGPETTAPDPTALAWWVFGLLSFALLLEWASRRTRGVR